MPNLQCQKELPAHNHLPSITISGTEGTRKLRRVTAYQSTFSSPVNQSRHLELIPGGPVKVGSPRGRQPPPRAHTWGNLCLHSTLGLGKHPSLIVLYPRGLGFREGGAGGAGLNYCSGVRLSPGQPTQHWVASLFFGGVLVTTKSNHICFRVTFTAPYSQLA